MQKILYRRQYLLSATPCERLTGWPSTRFGSHTLYIHGDCPWVRADDGQDKKSGGAGTGARTVILVGYVIDPHQPDSDNAHIARQFAKLATPEKISARLYSLSGRFVLFIREQQRLLIFHDAFGLRSVFYTRHEGELYAASQPLLLGEAIPLEKSENYDQYFGSEYIRIKGGHYIPAGASLYKRVNHLVPNHFLESQLGPTGALPDESPDALRDESTDSLRDKPPYSPDEALPESTDSTAPDRQIRYFPRISLASRSLKDGVRAFTEHLDRIMKAAASRQKLALSLSAGLDSRILLAACRNITDRVMAYTLVNHKLTPESADVRIPSSLVSCLGMEHRIIDCREPMDPDIEKASYSNTDIPHIPHWGPTAGALHRHFPQDRLAVKGDGLEIARGYYYKYKPHPLIISHRHFIRMIKGWDGIPFFEEVLARWFEGVRSPADRNGYRLLDLFYWEHEMGGWMMRNHLEWDIAQEVFIPYNNRELLDIALSVDVRHRKVLSNKMYLTAIRQLWKDALSEPVYPVRTRRRRLRKLVKKILKRTGLLRRKKRNK